jgi:hypothetical protein
MWMDDEPDRLNRSTKEAIEIPEKLSSRRAKVRTIGIKKGEGLAVALKVLKDEKDDSGLPDLIVIDQMLQDSPGDQRLPGREQAHDAVNLSGLERFIERERRQNRGEAFREHRLPRARGTDEQDIVTAGGGNLQGALDALLPFHFGKIHFVVVLVAEDLRHVHFGRRNSNFAFEELRGFAQILNGDDLKAGDDGGFGRVIHGDEHAGFSVRFGAQGNRQNAFARAHCARQREFADNDEIIQLIRLNLFAGREHADGDGEIKTRPFFFHVGRREIDRRAAHGEFETGIGQRGGDAILRFADGGIRQADDDDFGFAPASVYLDFDGIRFNSVYRGRTDLGQHPEVMGEFCREFNAVFKDRRKVPQNKIIFCDPELV